jgi:formate dehydrogenase maturation protein FdhE
MSFARRIARAEQLAETIPPAADLLRFYSQIASLQCGIQEANLPDLPLDSPILHDLLKPYEERVAQQTGQREPSFLQHVVLQAYAERQARRAEKCPHSVQPVCPFCGEAPFLAVLRPEGDGGKRFLMCSLCLTEWEYRRLLCPRCGEENQEKLPVFTADQFPYIRMEICETCKTYTKAIDLTKDGLAIPEVDDVASVALDLWAQEKGYTRFQANLLGL